MTASVVGSSTTTASAGATTIAVTRNGVTAGNLLWCIATFDAGGGLGAPTCADNVSGTWSAKLDQATGLTNNQTCFHFYSENSPGGNVTVTVTLGISASFRSITVVEISGVRSSGSLGGHIGNAQSTPGVSANAVTSTNITPSAQPGILVALSGTDDGTTSPPASGTGFTDNGVTMGVIGMNARVESLRLTSTSAIPATFTASGNVEHVTVAAVFLEPAVAGGIPLNYPQRQAMNMLLTQ